MQKYEQFEIQLPQVKEHHRRDGFEVGNADKIFESTSKEQLTRRAAWNTSLQICSGFHSSGRKQK